jgi:prevent-host-death family protein
MFKIGAFEAKTHLSSLLDRAAAGEEIVITKHGKPIARLVSAEGVDRSRADAAFDKLKLLRQGTTLDGISWKELRDSGRP